MVAASAISKTAKRKCLERLPAKTMGRRPKEADLTTYRGRFAARLRELRMKKFATQGDFVDALRVQGVEVREVTVSTWERGECVPEFELLPKIAATVGVPVRLLLPTE